MIQRVWHGYTTPANAAAYETLLKKEVFAAIKAKNIQGFCGLQLLKHERNGEVVFMTVLQFENLDAVKQFAGEDYEQAFVPPSAQKILSRYDDKATHYELVWQLA